MEKSVVDTSTLINAHGSSPQSTQRSIHLQRYTQPPRLSHRPSHRHATHELQQNSTLTRDTHHQPNHHRNVAVGALSGIKVEQAIVDMVVQAGGPDVSKIPARKTLTLKNAEARTQKVTSPAYIYNSPSGTSSSETTLVNTPTEAISPSKVQQECVEEAYASSEQRCSDEADCEIKRIRKELGDAEDENTKLHTQLSAAESRIRGLENSLLELQRTRVERESSLHQLGMDFYSRFRNVGRLISPHGRVWAEYKNLMNAAAQHLSISPSAEHEKMNSHDNVSRFEELSDVEASDGREKSRNEYRAPTLDTNMVMGGNVLTKKEVAIQAERNGTAPDDGDDDDEISRHDRPTRPGTASRPSVRFFTAQSEEISGKPSFSHLEGPQEAQEVVEPFVPSPSSSHSYPEVPVDLEEKCEVSNGFNIDFGSSHTILSNLYTAMEAGLSHATDDVERVEESTPSFEANQCIFSIPLKNAGGASGFNTSRSNSNRNDGRGRQYLSKDESRLSRLSELAYNLAVSDTSRQSQLEKSFRWSSPGVTDNRDSEPSEAEKETGSQILGASDANVDAMATVIDPSLEAPYNLLTQSINTVTELREARDGNMRMIDSQPENAPPENTPRAIWAPFPPVTKKSPLELMNELPLDWMLPTPPVIRQHVVQDRTSESSRSQNSSAVQEGMHMADMKAWIDSIAPFEKVVDTVKTLKIQPLRVTRKVGDAKNTKGQHLGPKLSSESQTGEAKSAADQQTQDKKPSSGYQTRHGVQAAHMVPPPFEEELLSLINGIRNLSLGPSIDTAGKVEKKSKAQVPRNSNVSGQRHTDNIEDLINGVRDLSLGPSVDAAGKPIKESIVQLSGDWNVSGRGQYSPKNLDKGPIFGRFLGRKSEGRDLGFTAKKERIATSEVEITKESDPKSKGTQSVVMPSKERSTRQVDAVRPDEQHGTNSPVPKESDLRAAKEDDRQRNTNNPRTTAHLHQSKTQNLKTDQPAVTASTTETNPQNPAPPQSHEPRPPIPRDDQPPLQTEEVYTSVYSLQGASYAETASKKKYRDPFSLRKDRK